MFFYLPKAAAPCDQIFRLQRKEFPFNSFFGKLEFFETLSHLSFGTCKSQQMPIVSGVHQLQSPIIDLFQLTLTRFSVTWTRSFKGHIGDGENCFFRMLAKICWVICHIIGQQLKLHFTIFRHRRSVGLFQPLPASGLSVGKPSQDAMGNEHSTPFESQGLITHGISLGPSGAGRDL